MKRNYTKKDGELVERADVWGVARFNLDEAKFLDLRAGQAKQTPSVFLGELMAAAFRQLFTEALTANQPKPEATPEAKPEAAPEAKPKVRVVKRAKKEAKAA